MSLFNICAHNNLPPAFLRNQLPCSNELISKVALLVFGILMIGTALTLYFVGPQLAPAVFSIAKNKILVLGLIGGTGGLSLLTSLVIHLLKKSPPHRFPNNDENPIPNKIEREDFVDILTPFSSSESSSQSISSEFKIQEKDKSSLKLGALIPEISKLKSQIASFEGRLKNLSHLNPQDQNYPLQLNTQKSIQKEKDSAQNTLSQKGTEFDKKIDTFCQKVMKAARPEERYHAFIGILESLVEEVKMITPQDDNSIESLEAKFRTQRQSDETPFRIGWMQTQPVDSLSKKICTALQGLASSPSGEVEHVLTRISTLLDEFLVEAKKAYLKHRLTELKAEIKSFSFANYSTYIQGAYTLLKEYFPSDFYQVPLYFYLSQWLNNQKLPWEVNSPPENDLPAKVFYLELARYFLSLLENTTLSSENSFLLKTLTAQYAQNQQSLIEIFKNEWNWSRKISDFKDIFFKSPDQEKRGEEEEISLLLVNVSEFYTSLLREQTLQTLGKKLDETSTIYQIANSLLTKCHAPTPVDFSTEKTQLLVEIQRIYKLLDDKCTSMPLEKQLVPLHMLSFLDKYSFEMSYPHSEKELKLFEGFASSENAPETFAMIYVDKFIESGKQTKNPYDAKATAIKATEKAILEQKGKNPLIID